VAGIGADTINATALSVTISATSAVTRAFAGG
jgi:hypothetical protein